jgi:hypothetical protein
MITAQTFWCRPSDPGKRRKLIFCYKTYSLEYSLCRYKIMDFQPAIRWDHEDFHVELVILCLAVYFGVYGTN